MCGIIGYTGQSDCLPVLTEGLKALEYRGYDSAGVACVSGGKLRVVKKKGRVSELEKILSLHHIETTCGIGHTRWATHGVPSDENSHPHTSVSGAIAVVHNGIIENYLPVKQELMNSGVIFRSQTDTEVIVHMANRYYTGDILEAVRHALKHLRGSYALAVLCADYPDKIVAACKESPLIVGRGRDGNYLASDIPALLKRCDELYRLKDYETAVISSQKIEFFDADGREILKEPLSVDWKYEEALLQGEESFMLKEIREIPAAIKKTCGYYRESGFFAEKKGFFASSQKIFLVGCGTAYHACLTGRALIERLAAIPCETDTAGEFRYREPLISPESVCVFVSQSGETADTLAAARLASERGAKTVCVTNVAGSALTSVCRLTLPIFAAPEIAVASTKAYNCQLAALYILAFALAHMHERINSEEPAAYESILAGIPDRCAEAVKTEGASLAGKYSSERDIYFLGRGLDYFTAAEGALKLKEISYVHCEAYPSGELKHGTLALIDDGTVVIAALTQRNLYEKSLNALIEVKARNARIIGLGFEDLLKEDIFSERIIIPPVPDIFAPLISIIPMQLFAYYMARSRGHDADKPRNLAKSVTVE